MKEILEVSIGTLTLFATIYLGLVGYRLTKTYSEKSDKINNDALFHNLFRDFNTRYSSLNSYLKTLEKKAENKDYTLNDLKNDIVLYDKVIDYLNLCSEEFYWFDQKRIDEKVWNAWHFGMKFWYQKIPILAELWKEEIAGENYKSYYLKEGKDFFVK